MTKQAFEDTYKTHAALVYNLVLHYLPQTEDAEEITQDVFVQIYHTFDTFKSQSSLKTWIYRIAINKCLDALKARKRQKRWANIKRIFTDDNDTPDTQIPDFRHPGILLEQQENAAILFKAIHELPEPQQTAFVLSHIEGLGNKEIADIMQRSIGATESLLSRAKQTLRKKLSNFYDEYRRN